MENNIRIKYKGEVVTELSPNTPSLDAFVKFVIDSKNIDVEQIACECDAKDFDCSFFEQAIRETVSDELNLLAINHEKFQEALSKIQNKE